jgi:hypothetical protein
MSAPRPSAERRTVCVPVPLEVALVYDGVSWSAIGAPPLWWLREQETLLAGELDTARASRARPARSQRVESIASP